VLKDFKAAAVQQFQQQSMVLCFIAMGTMAFTSSPEESMNGFHLNRPYVFTFH
jgi:hypothetical protein